MGTIRDSSLDPPRTSISPRPPPPTGLLPQRISRFVPAISSTPRPVSLTLLLKPGYDSRSIQECLCQKGVTTTLCDTHVLPRGGRGCPQSHGCPRTTALTASGLLTKTGSMGSRILVAHQEKIAYVPLTTDRRWFLTNDDFSAGLRRMRV
jgi:hypothetical protein